MKSQEIALAIYDYLQRSFFPPLPCCLLFPPHWYPTCTILNLLSTFHILVFQTCWGNWPVLHTVSVCVKYVLLLMADCIELALVKNTERWVSLPRIQIGNFGDFRNAPTWNTHIKGMRYKWMSIFSQLFSITYIHIFMMLINDFLPPLCSLHCIWILTSPVMKSTHFQLECIWLAASLYAAWFPYKNNKPNIYKVEYKQTFPYLIWVGLKSLLPALFGNIKLLLNLYRPIAAYFKSSCLSWIWIWMINTYLRFLFFKIS